MLAYFNEAWTVMLDLSMWLLLGSSIAGALHVWVPAGLIQRQFTGVTGVFKAVGLGVPLPLCSCGVIPTALGLKRDGASNGAALGFMTATPQTGLDSLFVSASFLGWPFALLKVLAALVTGVTTGLLADRVGSAEIGSAVEESPTPRQRTVSDGLAHSIDLVRMIWRWLVFGVLVSAALSYFLPVGAFSTLTGGGLAVALIAALLISLPLYVCTTASVPIAAALVASGMPTGAAMIFLMAGPATNVATLGAVFRGFGVRPMMVYVGTIVLGSVVFGLGYEWIFGDLVAQVTHTHEHTSALSTGSAVGLTGLLGWFAASDLRAWMSRRAVARAQHRVEVNVEGMTCSGCSNRLQRVLLEVDGVVSADVQLESEKAVVCGTASVGLVCEAINQAGFKSRVD